MKPTERDTYADPCRFCAKPTVPMQKLTRNKTQFTCCINPFIYSKLHCQTAHIYQAAHPNWMLDVVVGHLINVQLFSHNSRLRYGSTLGDPSKVNTKCGGVLLKKYLSPGFWVPTQNTLWSNKASPSILHKINT